MTSTIFEPLAEAIAAIAEGMSTAPTFKGYPRDPGTAGVEVPAVIVGLPAFARTPLDEPESQLGARDWHISFPVEMLLDLDDVPLRCQQLAAACEAFVIAMDGESIEARDGSVLVARVTQGAPVEYVDRARPLIGYVLSVDLHKLV
jgi:hypothetical protein